MFIWACVRFVGKKLLLLTQEALWYAPTDRSGRSQIYDVLIKLGICVLIFVCFYSWGELQCWYFDWKCVLQHATLYDTSRVYCWLSSDALPSSSTLVSKLPEVFYHFVEYTYSSETWDPYCGVVKGSSLLVYDIVSATKYTSTFRKILWGFLLLVLWKLLYKRR